MFALIAMNVGRSRPRDIRIDGDGLTSSSLDDGSPVFAWLQLGCTEFN